MQFTLATLLALGSLVAAGPIASPFAQENELERRTGSVPWQVAHMVFHGGPASYNLDVPADGVVYPTNNVLSINIIDTPDFNAFAQCEFYTDGQKALVQSFNNGVQGIVVGPPQPITGVKCTGSCIATYGDCYVNGQYVGSCCNGYCAANKCRPWY